MSKHILVISQYFYPQQFRINDICTEWVKRGYKVTVIAGTPNTPQGKHYKNYSFFTNTREIYNGINIIRTPTIPRGSNSIMLAFNYLSFIISGFFWRLFSKINADFVFIFGISPITQALPGIWYAGKRKIPSYIYVQDLWPESIESVTRINNRYVLGLVARIVEHIYKRCTLIFTSSNSFIESISKRGVSIEKIKYWPQYPEDFYEVLERQDHPKIPSDGKFNVTFTGNIGKAQGLDILPKTASLIKDNGMDKDIRFNIVGGGRYRDEFVKLISSMDLLYMFNFIPQQDPTRISELLASSDVAVLCLKDEPLFEMTVPAKLQSYMACGMPIVASVAGETRMLIEEAKCGLCSQPEDEKALHNNIMKFFNMEVKELEMLADNSKEYCDKSFNKKKLLDEMDGYLQDGYEMEEGSYV